MNGIFVKFDPELFMIKSNNKKSNHYFYKNKRIKNKIYIKFICKKCKKEIMKKINVGYLNNDFDLCKVCKRKQTNLKKYGHEVAYGFGTTEFKKNMIKRNNGIGWGSKKIREKIKQTNLDRYGYNHPSESKGVKEKVKQTMFNKYGSKNMFGSDYFKKKSKQTNLKRYGVENVFQSEKIKNKSKQTMLNKYGVEHALQVPKFHKKQSLSLINAYRSKTISENLHYQSNPELDIVNFCILHSINIQDGPSIEYYWNNKKHIYHIDFETDKYLIEIKSSHGWYYEDLESGKIKAKNKAAIKYALGLNKEFKFLLDIDDYNCIFNIK